MALPQTSDQWPQGIPNGETAWLNIGSVSIYRFKLDLNAEDQGRALALLSEEEKARAARFVREYHAARFAAGRAALRTILGSWMQAAPAGIRFEYGEKGKPVVARGPEFNLSHSHNIALLAVTTQGSVGIDIEEVDPRTEIAGIARSFFTAAETEELLALKTHEEQVERFYRLWTCKEAYLKARGTGISAGLNKCELSFDNDNARIVVPAEPAETKRWQIRMLAAPVGYIAAVCAETTALR